MTKEEIWQVVLAEIQLNISQANFATWFKNTKIISYNNGEALISVPNSFAKEWLENKYGKIISKILYNLNKEIKEVKYVIEKTELKTSKKSTTFLSQNEQFIKKQNAKQFEEQAIGQLEFEEFKINKETNLNPRYTFENFVVGSFNELSHAASWAISKKPGLVYNPLFIYGGVGLGKTHLIQAIGNTIIKERPNKKVKYIPSERFTADVVSSIKNQTIEDFKAKCREIDVLILDDIQFLSGKEKTQEIFFHTFNTLYENNKQIILSSDRPPKAITTLSERLRSRFEGGMTSDIGYPDHETKIAILKTKSQEKNINFTEDILDYIASQIQTNIRELEGALNKLIAHQKIINQSLNIDRVKFLLKGLLFSPKKIINPKKIIQIVSEFYDLKEKEILSSSRKKEIVKPRQIAMFLLRKELKNSYPFIGRKFGGKDHTTAIHAYEKISKEIINNEKLNEEIILIKERIYS
jgi:chromosomal replication initiator protein